jgi:hypothetical protein
LRKRCIEKIQDIFNVDKSSSKKIFHEISHKVSIKAGAITVEGRSIDTSMINEIVFNFHHGSTVIVPIIIKKKGRRN